MTTLIAWLGVDSRGPSSIYLASDSRITWDISSSWDHGRKLFVCRVRAFLFGYCGEAFLASQILGQVAEQIDGDLFRASDPDDGVRQIVSTVSDMLRDKPYAVGGGFELILAQRSAEGMLSTFHLHEAQFSRSAAPKITRYSLPKNSGVIGMWGSGAKVFYEHERRWAKSDVGGTSRAVFSAFADSIASRSDPLSGPPPQLVSLYRKGPGRPFGLIWEGHRYYYAIEIKSQVETRSVQWHNSLFEICDPQTLERTLRAQPQPRPSQLLCPPVPKQSPR